MRVGIMSMQRIRNYGSFLQAYSLKKNIEALGHRVEFVDYKLEPPINKESTPRLTQKHNKIKLIFSAVRRRLGIRTYSEQLYYKRKKFKARYDKEFYDMLGITKEKNYCPELDTLVIGSDEVFNCLQKNPEVGYSLQLFGADNKAKRLITYAASFGNTTLKRLEKYNKTEEIGKLLLDFDVFSVRDENSNMIIHKLTGKECLKHVDPVFIYDYPEINDIDILMRDYIVVYAYTNRINQEEEKAIKAFAKKHNKKIVCIGEYQNFCDKYISANPFELLAYIKKADYVITDTFHGTVFSIKLNKRFATIIRRSKQNRYGNCEKLSSLLDLYGLQDRRIQNIKDLEAIMMKPIDFTAVNNIIEREQNRSIEYLRENIKI